MFLLIWEGTPLGGGWVGGWVGGCGVGWGQPPRMCTHTCTCMHAHAHAHAYDIIGNSQWDIPMAMGAAICMKLSYLLRIHARAHMCMCVCAHVHVRGGGVAPTHPHPHPPTQPPTNPPKGGNTQNSEFSIRLELIEIILFHLKNLYL